jgi:hypothetical protein
MFKSCFEHLCRVSNCRVYLLVLCFSVVITIIIMSETRLSKPSLKHVFCFVEHNKTFWVLYLMSLLHLTANASSCSAARLNLPFALRPAAYEAPRVAKAFHDLLRLSPHLN